METLNRRQVIRAATAMGVWTLFAGSEASASGRWVERRDLFPEGVASGDPDHESVLLWTRYPGHDVTRSVRLFVEVAEDEHFHRVVARRRLRVAAQEDWTCRILVRGLKSRHIYWYRFSDLDGNGSRIGRTITAPAPEEDRRVSFACASCQDLNQSALNAYRRLMFDDRHAKPEDRLGFVLHLGDFIYEVLWYPEERPRNYGRTIREVTRLDSAETYRDMHVPVTLDDYRTIYRAYLHDPDLQDVRAYLPFVCIWDNHEFSWRGWQSFQVFGDDVRYAQTRKVAANKAWFEYQPARVRNARDEPVNRFITPDVVDAPIEQFDANGLGIEPNNLSAIESLIAYRSLRYGANVELIVTDLFSFRSQDRSSHPIGQRFALSEFLDFYPQDVMEILDAGRAYNGGRPPATIQFGDVVEDNFSRDLAPQTVLGARQKQWFKETLRGSLATWKVWACSNGLLDWRVNPHDLPDGLTKRWPSASFACFGGGDFSSAYSERAEICDFVRDHNIAGLAVLSGDRHSFWAGLVGKELPPRHFEPLGVSFITGSISSPGLVEAVEHALPPDHPLRALYLSNVNGLPEPTVNLLLKHGVRACLDYAEHGDIVRARSHSNSELSPHLSFVDMGGHGYSVVRATSDTLETEFVCIPRPNVRSAADDGGPVLYRVLHRAQRWAPGERPCLHQAIIEGDPKFSI